MRGGQGMVSTGSPSRDPSHTPLCARGPEGRVRGEEGSETHGLDEVALLLAGRLLEDSRDGLAHATNADLGGHCCCKRGTRGG